MELVETHVHIDFFIVSVYGNVLQSLAKLFVHSVHLFTNKRVTIVSECGTPCSIHILMCAVSKNLEIFACFRIADIQIKEDCTCLVFTSFCLCCFCCRVHFDSFLVEL
jgi:hypothetical protein